MKPFVIWMDYREAKVFKLVPQEAEKTRLKMHGHQHVKHPHGKQETHHHPEADKFFGEVAGAVKDASELLVMGPGEAKVLFRSYLEKHHKGGLFKALVGVETVDHPTENQILEKARSFFKKYDLFH